MQVLLQYQSKSYYIIGQEVYYSIGRFYYIIGQLLHYRAFFITLSGSYYSIGRLIHYRLIQPRLERIVHQLTPLQDVEFALLIGHNCNIALMSRDVVPSLNTEPYAQGQF